MPPKSVQIASWILIGNAVILKLLIPLGALALGAFHNHSAGRGDSPELLFMAGWFYLIFVTGPMLLVTALLFVKLRQGRNWARILVVIVTAISVFLTVREFQTLLRVYGKSLDLANIGNFLVYAGASPLALLVATALLFSRTAKPFFRGETYE